MPWARLDDTFHHNKKIMHVWLRDPKALAFHVMTISWCGKNWEGNGFVEPDWVLEKLQIQKERERIIGLLEKVGLWHPHGDGWVIHDYLTYNRSADQIKSALEQRKKAGKKGAEARYGTSTPPSDSPTESPNGTYDESVSSPSAARPAGSMPRSPVVPVVPEDLSSSGTSGRDQEENDSTEGVGVVEFKLGAVTRRIS